MAVWAGCEAGARQKFALRQFVARSYFRFLRFKMGSAEGDIPAGVFQFGIAGASSLPHENPAACDSRSKLILGTNVEKSTSDQFGRTKNATAMYAMSVSDSHLNTRGDEPVRPKNLNADDDDGDRPDQ